MTKQFHEGQEVEVRAFDGTVGRAFSLLGWRKAEIIARQDWDDENNCKRWLVQFLDGVLTRAVFDVAHIRAISPLDERFSRAPTTEAEHLTELAGDSAEEYPGLAEPDDDTSDPMGGEVSK